MSAILSMRRKGSANVAAVISDSRCTFSRAMVTTATTSAAAATCPAFPSVVCSSSSLSSAHRSAFRPTTTRVFPPYVSAWSSTSTSTLTLNQCRSFSTRQTSALCFSSSVPVSLPASALALRRVSSDSQRIRHFGSAATDSRVRPENVRNIAIIAHVDHGKTTLVDCLLRQSQQLKVAGDDRVMDHNALEKERGITILSKCTSVLWKSNDGVFYQINIVDTPGHADFGGEVERIMSMVESVILVVDAQDGPMTQTKFVLMKALKRPNMKAIVVINKVDRPTARVGQVENEVLDLFMQLGASDEQADFPIVYASAREGWATLDAKTRTSNMEVLFDTIVKHGNAPDVGARNAPFSMLVTQIEIDKFFGKLLMGRVFSGGIKVGDSIHAMDPAGKSFEETRVQKLLCRRGLDQVAVDEAYAGDMISVAGFGKATVNSTLADKRLTEPLPSMPIDPPTLSMFFSINTSPLGGRDGSQLTTGKLRDRLFNEAEHNVSLKVLPTPDAEVFEVRGRGELQLGVLIETMRREGFELGVSAPKVVYQQADDGRTLEPFEDIFIDLPDEFCNGVIEKLSLRAGELKEYNQMEGGKSRLSFRIPMRGLIGFRAELANDTAGNAVMNTTFAGYLPHVGQLQRSTKGAIISMGDGKCTTFALEGLQDRGVLFVTAGDDVYEGMVVGESSKEYDLECNPTRTKQLTNVRSVQKEDKSYLTPPRKMSLEQSIASVRDDEIIEVTTRFIRLRKKILNADQRKAAQKSEKNRAEAVSKKNKA